MKKGFFALLVAFPMLAGQMYFLPVVDAATHVAYHNIESSTNGKEIFSFPDGTKLYNEKLKIYRDISQMRCDGYLGSSTGWSDDTWHFVYDKQSDKFHYKDIDDIKNMMDWSSTVLVKAEVLRDLNPNEQAYYGGIIAAEYVVKVLDQQGNVHDYRLLCEKIDPLHQKSDGDFLPWAIAEYIPGSTELDPGRTAYRYPSVTLAMRDNPEWPDLHIIRENPSELRNEKYDKVENLRLTPGDVETINHALNDYIIDYDD